MVKKPISFIRKSVRVLIAFLLLSIILLNLTGCGVEVDHTMINKAFANSSIMNSIAGELQEQAVLIEEMRRIGLITDIMANNFNGQLNRIYKGVATLTADVPMDIVTTTNTVVTDPMYTEGTYDDEGNQLTPGSTTEGNTTTDTVRQVEVGIAYNDFIGKVLKSLTMLGNNLPTDPEPAKDITDVDDAKKFLNKYGSSVDAYSGYNTKLLVKNSNTTYTNLPTYSVSTAIPLNPFGEDDNGNASLSTVEALKNHINSLENIEVYYINPNQVNDSEKIQGLKAAISEAKAGSKTAETLASDYFISTGQTLKFKEDDLELSDIYDVETIEVQDTLLEHGTYTAAKYRMYKLNRETLLGAFNTVSNSGDLSSGILIGNKFFITRYPVAVFRGFQRDTADDTKYIPVFTHPFFLQDDGTYKTSTGTLLSGSIFEVSVSSSSTSYVDKFKSGDKGTAETKVAYIDLYTGAMYYKGEGIGNTNAYMSTGSSELESSVRIKSAEDIFILNNNATCITTVADTGNTTKFKPTEELQIGTATSINPKIRLPEEVGGTRGNIMPVVFLMEYLELVYSPNTVGTDAFTAYGRKVRLDESVILGKYSLTVTSGPVAFIIGEGATKNDWGNRSNRSNGNYTIIKMQDLMDIDGVYDTSLTAKGKDPDGEINDVSAAVRYIPASEVNFEQSGTIRSGDIASERSDILPQIAAGTGIECVMMFGATSLNAADSSSPKKTPLYGITLYGDLYDRGLFSQWINASGNANLTKWGQTVTALGYPSYAISNAVLTEKMKGNYAFELNPEGLLNIDLNTVVQINKELTEERRGGGIIFLRTALLILGFGLVSYVSVLLAAWALDVNLDLGFNLLEKVSFGHFVAVRSLDEMPDPDPDSTTTYVDYKTLIIRLIAFAAVGVILITIDPVNLIVKMLGELNFLFKVISEKLFGTTIM